MNSHYVIDPRHPAYGNYRRRHPDRLIARPGERFAEGTIEHGIGTGLDYAHPGNRAFVTGIICECFERFDVDGVELDFMRHPAFFPRRGGLRQPPLHDRSRARGARPHAGRLRRPRGAACCSESGCRRGSPTATASASTSSAGWRRAWWTSSSSVAASSPSRPRWTSSSRRPREPARWCTDASRRPGTATTSSSAPSPSAGSRTAPTGSTSTTSSHVHPGGTAASPRS